ncbi:MAG: histidinol-phosphate transaminase [Acidiferrobacterales bacterium]|nr:histidinol-phosphate transaminase [Acidiferrobacterales bacterium]
MSEIRSRSKLQNPTDLVHPQIRSLSAYRVEPFTGNVKLDAMESPYGFSESLRKKWLEYIAETDVNRYPDPNATDVKDTLRKVFEIPDSLQLTLGNGSDELLQLLQLAVGGYGKTIMAPQPSFAMYEIIARFTRAEFVGVDLDENFRLPRDSWLSAIERNQPACIFIAYPNNPTGNFFDEELIEETVRVADGLVVVDEAYHAYSGQSIMAMLEKYENLVIVRTLSKSGFAGLRVGYMMSHPSLSAEFEKVRFPYNIGVLAQRSAVFALSNWDRIRLASDHIIQLRDSMFSQLQRMDGIEVYPTQANFITIKVRNESATRIFETLQRDGVLIKNLHGQHPLLANCLRLTVGTEDENGQLLAALEKCL